MKILKATFKALILTALLAVWACSDNNGEDDNGGGNGGGSGQNLTQVEKDARQVMDKMWTTTAFDVTDTRLQTFDALQKWADNCSNTYFKNYLKGLDAASGAMETDTYILAAYRYAFDKVLDALENEKVNPGEVEIWMLYNMGYVIRTSSTAFAIDISHRWADKLVPYIDFMCITHNHSDHYDTPMIEAMMAAGKPVLSNYLKKNENYAYTSTVNTSYTLHGLEIIANLTDHNSSLTNFVTTYQIKFPSTEGDMVLMHVGDSNYRPEQYIIKWPIDVYIPRYAPDELAENNVLGSKVTPKYTLLSHILELSHKDPDDSRWSLQLALERATRLRCDIAVVPFWGEKLVWKNGTLK